HYLAFISRNSRNGYDSFMTGIRAVYYALMLWIPIETIYVFNSDGSSPTVTVSRYLGFLLFGLALIEWRSSLRRIPGAFLLVAWYLAVCALSQLWVPAFLDEKF